MSGEVTDVDPTTRNCRDDTCQSRSQARVSGPLGAAPRRDQKRQEPARRLAAEGYRVYEVTAEEMLPSWIGSGPDVLLLDLRVGDHEAPVLCERLRKRSDSPIVVLAVPGDESEIVSAIDSGADQYVTAPCGTAELLARTRAALRRGRSTSDAEIVEHGPVKIDVERHEVRVHGEVVHLPPREFDLLLYLAKHVGKILTHGMILRAVWGVGAEDDRAMLHVYVGQLRRKIERDPRHPALLLTLPGVGYLFATPSTTTAPVSELRTPRPARQRPLPA